MALTRRGLKAMGIDEEKIDEIIAMHTETVDALKAQVSEYKADADKLPSVQKQLDELRNAEGDDAYKAMYEKEHQDFEDYKAEQAAKETKAAKENAYRALLAEAGIEKRIDAILKVTDIDGIELNQDGSIRAKEKLLESIKTEWADFIPTVEEKGAEISNPPANTDAGRAAYEALSLSEKMKYANDHPQEVAEWSKK